MSTPRAYIESSVPQKLAEKPSLVKEINSVVVFNITGAEGGQWTLDCTEAGGGKITEGAAEAAKCTVTVADTDFASIVTKKINAQMAAMTGKLKIKGDMGVALKLTKIL